MHGMTNRRIVLGVTGGIAAYKAPELVRRLREAGAEVRVVMTRAAEFFVTPLSLQAVSGQPVHRRLFDPAEEAAMDHIALARWAEAVLVAPASAHLLARLAHGLADDLLTTLCLATTAPIALAPAMNHQMWSNPATRDNLGMLLRRGLRLFGPGEGDQACGETGPGRMLEPAELVQLVSGMFVQPVLAGVKVMVTAGPTREPIDPVRFVGNRSSGKMGYAVAGAAAEAGARVTLISGPTALDCPPGVQRIPVETAAEMHAAVLSRLEGCQVFIAAAAVADYTPMAPAGHKIKKHGEALDIRLTRNPDILSTVAAHEPAPFTVGFAAETRDVEQLAEQKRLAKGVDMMAANRVGGEQGGFERDENALTVSWEGGRVHLPLAAKAEIGRQLIRLVAERFYARD